MKRRLVLSAATLVVVSACSGSDDSAPQDVPATTAGQGDAAVTTVAAAPESTDPFVPGFDTETITQLTPTSGAGLRPLLEWEPVSGAARYSVIVFNPDGSPWWSWGGDGTEVILGGVSTDAPIGGPVAKDGVTWVVFAFDADEALIGVSPQRPVSE